MLSCLNQVTFYDAASAFTNKFNHNFVNSLIDTFATAQFIEQVSLLPNECVKFLNGP